MNERIIKKIKTPLSCRNLELLLRLKDKQQCSHFTSISNEAYFKTNSSIPLNCYPRGK